MLTLRFQLTYTSTMDGIVILGTSHITKILLALKRFYFSVKRRNLKLIAKKNPSYTPGKVNKYPGLLRFYKNIS